jgi:hypothetical protein
MIPAAHRPVGKNSFQQEDQPMWARLPKKFAFPLVAILVGIGSSSLGLAVNAQDTETLIQGDIDNGFVLAPDFKFTEIDGSFANLAGAYGGWLINNKLLLGGGGYTLTNRSDDFKMTYGGFVLEYFFQPTRLVNFSVKGLVGGGKATLPGPFKDWPMPLNLDEEFNRLFGSRNQRGKGPADPTIFPPFPIPDFDDIEESFFIAEPEANVVLNVTDMIRIGFGGGYRLIGGAGRINKRLDGWTANANMKLVF